MKKLLPLISLAMIFASCETNNFDPKLLVGTWDLKQLNYTIDNSSQTAPKTITLPDSVYLHVCLYSDGTYTTTRSSNFELSEPSGAGVSLSNEIINYGVYQYSEEAKTLTIQQRDAQDHTVFHTYHYCVQQLTERELVLGVSNTYTSGEYVHTITTESKFLRQ